MEYGSIAATRGSADKTEKRAGFSADVQRALFRYFDGEWGELCEEAKRPTRGQYITASVCSLHTTQAWRKYG